MRTKPNPVDVHVGSRIRKQRIARGLSRGELATLLGVQSEKVKNYETGSTRVGASHLLRVSEILEAPISYFFMDFNRESDPDVDIITTRALLELTRDDDAKD